MEMAGVEFMPAASMSSDAYTDVENAHNVDSGNDGL